MKCEQVKKLLFLIPSKCTNAEVAAVMNHCFRCKNCMSLCEEREKEVETFSQSEQESIQSSSVARMRRVLNDPECKITRPNYQNN